jgi:hypothetical protein
MNAHLLLALSAVVTVVSMPNRVFAQRVAAPESSRANSVVVAPVPIDDDFYASHFSSTHYEGLGRGLEAIGEGVGKMNLYNSVAAANFEEARRRAIENHRLYVENYYAMKRMNQEYRESQVRRRGSTIYTPEVSKGERPNASQPVVRRTSPVPVDQLTGAIEWPEPLRGPEYSHYRRQLESRLADRTAANQTATARRQVHNATWYMKEQLRSQIRKMSSSDYLTAKKFIDNLAREFDWRFRRESQRLAAR